MENKIKVNAPKGATHYKLGKYYKYQFNVFISEFYVFDGWSWKSIPFIENLDSSFSRI